MKNYKAIAIIPARGGSKRIHQKNIRPFLGKPIISYSIDVAKESGIFDEIMVSTDSPEIADTAKKYGASIPFFRSDETANDHAVIADVMKEVIRMYSSLGKSFQYICCIFPTAPLLRKIHLVNGFRLLEEKGFDSVFPVQRFAYPVLRSLKMTDGRVEMNWPEHLNTRSQDLPPAYHDAGQFYWMSTKALTAHGKIFTPNSGGIELDEMEIQDIDNESDWLLAEIKYKILNNEFQGLTR